MGSIYSHFHRVSSIINISRKSLSIPLLHFLNNPYFVMFLTKILNLNFLFSHLMCWRGPDVTSNRGHGEAVRYATCVSGQLLLLSIIPALKYTWELTRTFNQLILIYPYYITMKSTCFNH